MQHRYQLLDWLRFGAAAIVFLGHLRGALFVEYGAFDPSQKSIALAALFAITRLGHEAVILFFVLSGFFVAGPSIARITKGTFKIADYSTDRISRIFIPYLPALGISAICAYLNGGPISIVEFVVNLFGLQGVYGSVFCGNSPLWSLAYEIWFYITMGAIGVVLNRKSSGIVILVSSFLLFFCATVFTKLSATYFMCWLFGGLAYFFVESKVSRLVFVASLIAAALACVFLQVTSESKSIALEQWNTYLPSRSSSELLLAVALSGMLPFLANLKLSFPGMNQLDSIMSAGANVSYTFYLIHYPIINVIQNHFFAKSNNFNRTSCLNLIVTTSVVFIITAIVYYLFERNTKIARRWMRSNFSPISQKEVVNV